MRETYQRKYQREFTRENDQTLLAYIIIAKTYEREGERPGKHNIFKTDTFYRASREFTRKFLRGRPKKERSGCGTGKNASPFAFVFALILALVCFEMK